MNMDDVVEGRGGDGGQGCLSDALVPLTKVSPICTGEATTSSFIAVAFSGPDECANPRGAEAFTWKSSDTQSAQASCMADDVKKPPIRVFGRLVCSSLEIDIKLKANWGEGRKWEVGGDEDEEPLGTTRTGAVTDTDAESPTATHPSRCCGEVRDDLVILCSNASRLLGRVEVRFGGSLVEKLKGNNARPVGSSG